MELSQLTAEQYEEFRKYIPVIFTDAPSSVFTSFVTALSTDQAKYLKEFYDFKDNLNVLSANTLGVTAWESFLGLPDRPDLSLQARRGRLFSRMTVFPATLKTLQDVVKSYIGSDQFEIFEYYTFNEPASAFWYDVRINTPNVVSFIKDDLQMDLERLQPAHCKLIQILDPFQYLTDTISSSDNPSLELLHVFISDVSVSDGPDLPAP